jgi:class 3 adenylate cyclase
VSDPPEDAPATREELERENRRLARKLSRLTDNVQGLEILQDTNSKLLSSLTQDLERERARSRELLLNILPAQIVDRLEAGETMIADRYDDVTVLFSDFVGFTEISSRMPPADLVAELNALFSEFDALCVDNGVEKIKTIGDAYLAVAGLPGTREDHAAAIAETALGMVHAIERLRSTASAEWHIRIGIHGGPVVAGVIGTRKFVYDVWGDAVNVASRLESSSAPGRIHVSDRIVERLAGAFAFEPRGTIELKGKGQTPTHFLLGRRA